MKKPSYGELVKALKIYDDCMQVMSSYLGHTKYRTGDEAWNQGFEACERAMKAQAILDRAVAK
jgi:hypothetical protein